MTLFALFAVWIKTNFLKSSRFFLQEVESCLFLIHEEGSAIISAHQTHERPVLLSFVQAFCVFFEFAQNKIVRRGDFYETYGQGRT